MLSLSFTAFAVPKTLVLLILIPSIFVSNPLSFFFFFFYQQAIGTTATMALIASRGMGETLNSTLSNNVYLKNVIAKQTKNMDLLTYSNPIYGIRISYPSNWKVSGQFNNSNIRNVNIAKFYLPPHGPSLTISRDTISQNEDQNTYLAETIQSYRHSVVHLPDFTVIKTNVNNSIMAGLPGYELLYSYSKSQGSTIDMFLGHEIGVLIGNKVYYTSYLANIPDYSIYKPVINKMLDSLQINTHSLGTKSQRSDSLSKILGDAGEI